jgi:hypothetical protein
MTEISPDLEPILCDSYRRQALCYRQSLELAVAIQSALEQGQEVQRELEALAVSMQEISKTEAETKEARQTWDRSGKKPGSELQSLLGEVAHLIRELLARIGEAEKHAQLQADRLGPQLDQLIRSQQMRRAYGGIMVRR